MVRHHPSPVMPQRMLGLTMLPPVSLPTEKPTNPAAVAAPGPALDPDALTPREAQAALYELKRLSQEEKP